MCAAVCICIVQRHFSANRVSLSLEESTAQEEFLGKIKEGLA